MAPLKSIGGAGLSRRDPACRVEGGSVLVLVLITILFTSFALIAFIDKAGNDLLVEARVAQSDRLRMEAYSALEVTLSVLEDFREADSGLRTPAEGWGDPLDWAGWTPSEGRTVDVSFSDESGKIPLIHANATVLMSLFTTAWQMKQDDAQRLTDALLAWMQQNYVPQGPLDTDYEQSALPYAAPLRSIRSFGELAAIDVVRDLLFDANGRPNDLWWRFVNDFSVFNYARPNANGANSDVLMGVGEFSPDQIQAISDYQAGTGKYATLGTQWFQRATDLTNVVGTLTGNPRSFTETIQALKILITVHEGKAAYRLAVTVAPQGGARTVQTTATDIQAGASNSGTGESTAASSAAAQNQSKPTTTPSNAQAQAAAAQNLQYPFTILEIRENDGIPTPPPPPPTPTS